MNTRDLRYFVMVCETLSFTEAAKRLGMAQPPLSIRIKSLESELGVILFRRTSRRVELTSAGETLRVEAEGIINRLEEATLRMRDLAAGRTKGLRIGVDSAFAGTKLARRFRKFQRKNRGIRCYFVFLPASPTIKRDQEIDLFIMDRSKAADFQITSLGTEPVMVAVPKKHRLIDRNEVDFADLTGEHFILSDSAQRTTAEDAVLRADPTVISRGSIQGVTSSTREKLWLVESGQGIGFFSLSELEDSKITRVSFKSDLVSLEPVIAHLPEATSEIVSLVVGFLADAEADSDRSPDVGGVSGAQHDD